MKKSKWRRYVAAVTLLLLAESVILGFAALKDMNGESDTLDSRQWFAKFLAINKIDVNLGYSYDYKFFG